MRNSTKTILMVGLLFCLFSQVNAQNITLKTKKITVKEAIEKLKQTSGYSFVFEVGDLDTQKLVSINANNASLATVINQIISGQKVSYTISGKSIIITKAPAKQPSGKAKTISGVVFDDRGDPVIGANISIKGTTQGAISDIDGKFTLDANEGQTLLISYVGFLPKEISVTAQSSYSISMNEDSRRLEEIVVIGYGSVSKKELTSAISHISSKDFLNVGGIDPAMMIQGKVAGVSITNTSAADPNSQSNIQIRGVSSRAAGLGPLIVIDGIPGGNLTNVNPNDIESFDILKDGAASAIYGTRGSNGVVLITTKKGNKDGQVHTSYSGQITVNQPTSPFEMLNADEFRKHRVATGKSVDLGSNTDWTKEITQTGFSHQHTLSVSGGNSRSNYRVSLDYRDAKGVDIRSGREEYGGRASISHTTKGGLFTFTANIAPRVAYRNNSSQEIYKIAMEANPTVPIFDPKDPTRYSSFLGITSGANPVEEMRLDLSGGETKLLDWDGTAKLNLLPLLATSEKHEQSLTTQITFADQQNDNFNFWYRPSTSTISVQNGFSGEASREYQKSRQQSIEWLANYSGSFNGHRIKALAGYSYQYFQNSGMNAENKDFPSDGLTYNNISQGEWAKAEKGRLGMGSYKNDSKLIAFFGRIGYDYKEKYMVTASLRYEGSSKFGNKNKWGYFPAVSAGWRISEESFMKNVDWVNELKVRGDLGVTGNQNFDSYLSLSTMQGFGSYYYNGKFFTVWGPSKNPNPNLKWEKGVNWNVGADFALFNNRLTGSLNYYYRKQQDLLGDYTVPSPPYLFPTTFVNVGTMRNTGVEIELNFDAVKTKDFSYQLGFAGTTIENKFLSFSNTEFIGQDYYDVCSLESPNNPGHLQRIQEGERLGNFYTWAYAGISEKGDWMVWNADNTEKIPIQEAKEADKRITGNGLPQFTASLTNTFNYKNWGLTLFFRGAFGYDIFNVHDLYYGLQSMQGNVMKKAYEKNAAITTGQNVLTDYFLEKGDYVKLDMVTLDYTFRLNKKYIESAKIFVTGRNLATITGFSGVDPATYQINGLNPGATDTRRYYPSCVQMLFGVQVTF